MLCLEPSPLFWYPLTLSEGNGTLLAEPLQADSLQTKDFAKFLGLIAILYLGMWAADTIPQTNTRSGFNTCFAFLARGTYSFSKMSYILVKVFFGSSYLGFVSAHYAHSNAY